MIKILRQRFWTVKYILLMNTSFIVHETKTRWRRVPIVLKTLGTHGFVIKFLETRASKATWNSYEKMLNSKVQIIPVNSFLKDMQGKENST